jgi:sugar transferase (PEP-CTERM/EpsH1 system associated)
LNILFIVPYIPNKIRVRPYNLIRYLAQLGHQITLLTIWTSEEDRLSLEDLNKYCDRIITVNLPTWRSFYNCLIALPTKEPLQAVYSWDPKLAEELYKLATQINNPSAYDIVHVEHLRGARYGIDLISRSANRIPRIPIIWDSVDSISLLFRQTMLHSKSLISRELARFELGRTERYEGWLVDQFNRILVTSEEDKRFLLSLRMLRENKSGVEVLPNGVDLGYFSPVDSDGRDDQTVVLSGKMSYHANISMVVRFIEEIMPFVWEKLPDVKVWVVGKDPPPRLLAYAQNQNIQVTGTVGDMRPYLTKATVSVAPISYGVGIQNKVLEAMACATPVIASQQAVSALSVEAGKEIIVADNPLDFAKKVVTLLNERERRDSLGRAGRQYVERNHDWSVIASRLEEVYTQSLHQQSMSTIETMEPSKFLEI